MEVEKHPPANKQTSKKDKGQKAFSRLGHGTVQHYP